MGTSLATAYFTLRPKIEGIESSIKSGVSGVDLTASGRRMGEQIDDGIGSGVEKSKGRISGLGTSLKSVAGVAAGAFAAVGFGQLIAEAGAAADATQKFKTTLDFAGLDTSQIDALTESTRAYADQTVYELSDIQSITAQLAANNVKDFDRLAEAAGNLNAVAGGNAETFKSVGMVLTQTAGQGKLTTENWNQLADAIPGASGKLQQALLDAGAYTGNFREAMEKGEISAEEFNQAMLDLGFQDAAVQAATSTSTIEGSFGNLKAEVVGGLSDTIAQLTPFISAAMGAISSVVGPAFQALNGGLQQFVGFVQANAPMAQAALQPLVDAFGRMRDTFAPIIDQVMAQLVPALGGLMGALQNVWGAIQPILIMAMDTLAPIVSSIVGYVVSIVSSLMESLTPAINNIAAIVQAVLPIVQTAFQVCGTYIQGVIDAVFPYIETVVNTVMDVINAVISTVLSIVQGDWEGAWNSIKDVAQSIWDGIGALIEGAISAVQGVIDAALQFIQSAWDNVWNGAKNLVSDAWEGIKTAVSDGIDGMMSFIEGIPDAILGFFGDAGNWLKDSGKAIIDGFTSGIKGAIDGAVNAVSGMLGSIRDLFPFSPAKEGPFSGKGWVLYSGMSIADAMGEGFAKRAGAMADTFSYGLDNARASLAAPAPAMAGGYTFGDVHVTIDGGSAEDVFDQLMRGIERAKRQYAGRW